MFSLIPQIWRRVGRYLPIKDIGSLECVCLKSNESLDTEFWKWIWINHCHGRIFKARRRKYKMDVLVYYAKEVHRNMRYCTSINRWYNNWNHAVIRRRQTLQAENKSLENCIRYSKIQMRENKRKLEKISRVEQQATTIVRAIRSYPQESCTGPMRTQLRRIEEELLASRINPWAHYYADED